MIIEWLFFLSLGILLPIVYIKVYKAYVLRKLYKWSTRKDMDYFTFKLNETVYRGYGI